VLGKITTAFLVAAVAAGLGWKIYTKTLERLKKPEARRRSVAVAVQTAPVRRATVRDIAQFAGTLAPRRQFLVAPKIAGRLEKLLVDIGDKVDRGQLMAVLDSAEYVQQVESAKAELAVVRARVAECSSNLALAKREFDRRQSLRQRMVASESELDEAQAVHEACKAKHQVALAEVQRQEAALKGAEVRLSYAQISATWEQGNGPRVVGERFVDEGAMLRANQPIASVIDLHTVKAVIHVIERDYAKIRSGQTAAIETDAYPGQSFEGRVVRVAPVLREASRQARVDVEVPNPDRLLKPGMFVRAQIEFDRHENATVAPLTALVRRQDRQGVFCVVEAKSIAHFVPVKIGILEGDVAEIVEPTLSGRVVTLGQHLLEDGAAIRLPKGAGRNP